MFSSLAPKTSKFLYLDVFHVCPIHCLEIENYLYSQIFFFVRTFSSFISRENVKDYVEHRSKYAKKKCGRGFEEAVTQIDEFISDPIVCVLLKIIIVIIYSTFHQLRVVNLFRHLLQMQRKMWKDKS